MHAVGLTLAVGVIDVVGVPATAQNAAGQDETSNVFVDDSTAAQSTLRALPSLLRAGNALTLTLTTQIVFKFRDRT